MIPLNAPKKFTQGIFTPLNPKKYIGREKPVYRSGYELRFFRWCDNNPNVLEWSSETVIIPYISPLDQRVHRYYVDGIIALREPKGIVKYIVEIKPSAQVVPPVPGKKRKATLLFENRQYIVNTAKWNAARQYAAKHGLEFVILTEKELGIK